MSNMNGGKKISEERHFRVVDINGKKKHFGGISLKNGQTPINAAMKLLTSIAHEKGLEKMNKLKLGTVHFSIQEYTRGSKGKVYGPYKGYFHEYTAAEKKAAVIKTSNGKYQSFKMKAVVKLMKKTNNKKTNNKTNNKKKGGYVDIDNLCQHEDGRCIEILGEGSTRRTRNVEPRYCEEHHPPECDF